MASDTTSATSTTPATRQHPLDPLSALEITAVVAILRREAALDESYRFVAVELREPSKDLLALHSSGDAVEREAHIVLLDRRTGSAYEAVVSLTADALVSWTYIADVQPAVMLDEFDEVEVACKRDNHFREALAKRGITDMDLVCVDPWSAGFYGDDAGGKRLMRGLIYVRTGEHDNPYAHPVENLIAVVDLNRMQVDHMEDHGVVPVPGESGNYAAEFQQETREIAPLEIAQPSGPGFELDGYELRWQNWELRIGFTAREGVVLHQVSYRDGDVLRSVLSRASLSEMVVPYGDPHPIQAKKNAFDAGEYNIGQLANSLKLGCDCLGEIRYLDAALTDSAGRAVVIKNAVCLHEEDAGLLWKHTDFRTDEVDVRRSRRMVISFIATVANYEYAFYWNLYQDGAIELEVKLTGIVSTGARSPDGDVRYGQLLNTDGLYAPVHQHLFNVRLDIDVDGSRNSVYEVDIVAPPMGSENPYGNAFYAEERLLESEAEGRRNANPETGRHWKVVNSERINAVGESVGYRLVPRNTVSRYAHVDAHVSKRSGFTEHHLWVTPYDDAERYAAGDYPNQSGGGDGLPSWTASDRPIADTDVVLWHTFGTSHVVRLEDWPVMPVQRIGFMLEPVGFFDRNPTLDVPSTEAHHPCHG